MFEASLPFMIDDSGIKHRNWRIKIFVSCTPLSQQWLKKMNTVQGTTDNKDEVVPLPGFRFHPTDEELVGFYLRRKVDKKPLRIELIKQVDIYKFDPWDLPSKFQCLWLLVYSCMLLKICFIFWEKGSGLLWKIERFQIKK